MPLRKFILCFSILFSCIFSTAQEKSNAKFGKISPADFANKVYNIDSNANAVVIADIGSTEILGNSKGAFSFEYKRYRRAHILNKNGYGIADVVIPVYKQGIVEEKLDNLRAVTYNLEDGKVVETKLDKSNIFKEELDRNRTLIKFTFPNIKEGSIIEYECKIISDYFWEVNPWEFQGEYPELWSEYNFSNPEFFNYVFLMQGYMTAEKSTTERREHFRMNNAQTSGSSRTESDEFDADVTDYRWVMKNVPALKEESYTTSINNYIAKLTLIFSFIRYPFTPKDVLGTWPESLKNVLIDNEYFGADLKKNNNWLSDVVKPIIAGTASETEKAEKIFAYVRDNLTCTHHSGMYLTKSLKEILRTRNGNDADINLLLTAMLKYAGINSDPVILSTRSNGVTYSIYPVLDKFNYVICLAHPEGKDVYLDASWPRLGFGNLTTDCYNGHARVVNDDATPLNLSADSVKENSMTSVLLTSDEKGNLIGSFKQTPGYYESHSIREKIKEKGKDEYFKDLKKEYGQEMAELTNTQIDSLDRLEESINVSYDFQMNIDKDDIIYLNPMMGEGYKQNPFKSAQRMYPVEMPYVMNKTYGFTLIVPDGYVVDEIPKPAIVKFNEEGDGIFEYRITQSENTISLRTRIMFTRATFQPEEYDVLREFFNLIVKKESEQIVLKKKK